MSSTQERVLRIVTGVASLLGAAAATTFVLLATNIITFTERTQSIELPEGRILDIYRTSKWEYYDCKFELRNAATGEVQIPKTRFDTETYRRFKSATTESTPESRTTYVALIGPKSGVVGLASSEDTRIVLLLIDPANLQHVAATPAGLSAADKALGDRLLSALKLDYPDHALALEATEEAARFRSQRPELENVR